MSTTPIGVRQLPPVPAFVIKQLPLSGEKALNWVFKDASLGMNHKHPFILPFYGVCNLRSSLFLVYEDATKHNFAQFFGNGAHREIFWDLFFQASAGLRYLTSKKVVHGNLKCANLLIGPDGKAKITDFETLVFQSSSRTVRSIDTRWTAPEYLRGDINKPDSASDIYAFGMCIEAWTGHVPWSKDVNEIEIADAGCKGQIPLRPHDMSNRGWQLIQRMCHAKPSCRPTMSQVSRELSELMETERMTLQEYACADCGYLVSIVDVFCAICGFKLSLSTLRIQCKRHQSWERT